jgi:hypothetical protein
MFHDIIVEFDHRRPVCDDMVLDWLYPGHRLLVLPDTLRDVIRCNDAFKPVLGIPIESGRCQVTVEAIQKHFQQLPAGIENMPAGFVFHADESGFQDFADARRVQVIVPTPFKYDSINIPSSRSEEPATMLAGISVDGCTLKPMIITQRKRYELERFESNFMPDNMLIVHRKRGFIVRPLFDLWADSVLFPEIQGRFIEYQHEGSAVPI